MLRSDMGAALLGTQLASVMTAGERVVSPRPNPVILHTASVEAVGVELRAMLGNVNPAGTNYPAANVTILVPFGIAEPILVLKLWLENGAAVAGNIDLGIFGPDGTLIVGKGSTGQSGTSVIQELDITDTRLDPGRYYLGITSDTSDVTQKVLTYTAAVSGQWSVCGVLQAAQGPPLVSVTLATCAQLSVPWMGLSARSLVV
jgi:hypothetical protein